MKNVILVLLTSCVIGLFYGMVKLKKLLATGEENSFNIMSVQDLSEESKSYKGKALIGFSILIMLVLVSIYGPIKG